MNKKCKKCNFKMIRIEKEGINVEIIQKNNFSDLQLKILDIMEKQKIMSIYDLSKFLEKPKTTIWDSIFNNKNNLKKYIAIVTKYQTKIGRPKTFLVLIGEV